MVAISDTGAGMSPVDPGVQLLTKPFTFEQLAIKVRSVLDKA
jgi:hypothetical protein